MFTSLFSILSDFFFISCFSYLIYDPMEWNKGKKTSIIQFFGGESIFVYVNRYLFFLACLSRLRLNYFMSAELCLKIAFKSLIL